MELDLKVSQLLDLFLALRGNLDMDSYENEDVPDIQELIDHNLLTQVGDSSFYMITPEGRKHVTSIVEIINQLRS